MISKLKKRTNFEQRITIYDGFVKQGVNLLHHTIMIDGCIVHHKLGGRVVYSNIG